MSFTLTLYDFVTISTVNFVKLSGNLEEQRGSAIVPALLVRPSTAGLSEDEPEHSLWRRWADTLRAQHTLEGIAQEFYGKAVIIPDLRVGPEDGGLPFVAAALYKLRERLSHTGASKDTISELEKVAEAFASRDAYAEVESLYESDKGREAVKTVLRLCTWASWQ